MKSFFLRLKSPVVITSIVSTVYIIFASKFNLPDWAEVSTQVLAAVYTIFGLTNNPADHENY